MTKLTIEELRTWLLSCAKTLLPQGHVEIRGVHLSPTGCGSIKFSYKDGRCTGLAFPDNGYLGKNKDGKDYYPLLRLSCRYSKDSRYNPGDIQPDLESLVSAILQSWKDFTA
jgi:hypothetical protein